MKSRVQITDVSPVVECGRFAAKAVVGERVVVGATVFREGHSLVAACIRAKGPDDRTWREEPLTAQPNDRFYGSFAVDQVGAWRFQVMGWTDHWATWLDGLVKKHEAGVADLELELEEGAQLLDRRDGPRTAKEVWARAAGRLRDREEARHVRVAVARDPELQLLLDAHPERLDASTTKPALSLWVDRERAGFSAWYEMFPRSEGSEQPSSSSPGRSGTFADAAKRLPAIAQMGFDVVYLPPIHPIGQTHRKGRNNSVVAEPGDPGVPWAIGSEAGGHDAVHPDLGTLDDFDDFVAAAQAQGLEVALDYAIQCSPDHPWVREHPEWFKHRPDGSIAYAENPPKKYQDIYPIDFDTPDIEGLRAELKRILEFWMDHGVRIFRVDNPHTKALTFWEWVIDDIHQRDPGVVFLAEAFTRPPMMKQLAKLGFTQSYTYFAWRNTKQELQEYLTELAHGPMADYYRPNFWPNTPDILTEFLQTGGPAAFKLRLVLAATMAPNYGIYSGYELFEHVARNPGSEEYLDSEKYQFRPRDWDVSWSLAPFITHVNGIRTAHHAQLGQLRNIWFHPIDNDQLICYSKVAPGRTDPLLVVVNLDPHHAQEGWTALDMWQLGLEDHHGPVQADDLVTGQSWTWHGPHNWVRLDPHHGEPAHILALRAR